MVVDARYNAATCLMLVSNPVVKALNILERVGAAYPKVIEERTAIRLRAAMESSFGNSKRTSIPFDDDDMFSLVNRTVEPQTKKKKSK
jgi:hypothetical protein